MSNLRSMMQVWCVSIVLFNLHVGVTGQHPFNVVHHRSQPEGEEVAQIPEEELVCEGEPEVVKYHFVYRELESSFRMAINQQDQVISNPLRGGKEFEAFLKDFAAHALNFLSAAFPNQQLRMLDAGANIGLWGFWFASLGYEVHMFEPMPINMEKLACTLHINPKLHPSVHLVNAGLGDGSITEACFWEHENNKGAFGIDSKVEDCPNKMQITSVDYYWKNLLDSQPVHIFKIDVEGYETMLFDGANEFFKATPPMFMLVEFSPFIIKERGDDFEGLFDKLTEWGYRIFVFAGWKYPKVFAEVTDNDGWSKAASDVQGDANLFDTWMVHSSFPNVEALIEQWF